MAEKKQTNQETVNVAGKNKAEQNKAGLAEKTQADQTDTLLEQAKRRGKIKKRRWLELLLIIVTLTTFALIMNGVDVGKKPLYGAKDNVEGIMLDLTAAVQQSNWQQAELLSSKLDWAFGKVEQRIQFGCSREDLLRYEEQLAILQSDIAAADQQDACRTLAVLQSIWEGLGE